MALANEKVVAGVGVLRVSWTIVNPSGNAIIVKWRPTGSSLQWAFAPAQQLAPTATNYVITGLAAVAYDVQVGQVQFGSPQTVVGVKPVVPPDTGPINISPPVIGPVVRA